jgi:hypothetical protein
LPPVFIHAVKVGAGVGVGRVIVLVALGVVVGGIFVNSGRFGDEIVAVSVIKGAGDAFTIVGVAMTPTGFNDTDPHACKRITRIHTTGYLLRTLAVYHNKHKGSSILNL